MNNKSVMETLKDNSWDLHKKAERTSFMTNIFQGDLDVSSLLQYLEQLYFIHSVLDILLEQAMVETSPISDTINKEQFQAARLLSDMKCHGVSPDPVSILPATAEFIETMKSSVIKSDTALLGFHYVFEGSKMGGMIISKALINTCDWLSDECLSYFNPYGDDLFSNWMTFAQTVNKMDLNQDEVEEACRAARVTFKALIQITSNISNNRIGQVF